MATRLKISIIAFLCIVLSSIIAALPTKADDKITVFAAASLKNALDRVNKDWLQESGVEITVSYAASPALAKQIAAGAPADLFISADMDWMNFLIKKDLIDPTYKQDLLTNKLVLIANNLDAPPFEINEASDFKALLGTERLAIASVDTVPAGKYAKAAFENLGHWQTVKDRLAPTDNVRAALLLVSRGEAPYGVVYSSDAASDKNVKVIAEFPPASHPKIIYPMAIVTGSASPKTISYFEFLKSKIAKALFEAEGFTVIDSE